MSDLGPQARSILEAGRSGDDPTSADRARVRRALMRSIAAGGAIGAAAATGEAVAGEGAAAVAAKAGGILSGLVWKVAGGIAVVGAIGAGILATRAQPKTPAPVAAITTSAAAEPSSPSAASEAPPPVATATPSVTMGETPKPPAPPPADSTSKPAPPASAERRAAAPRTLPATAPEVPPEAPPADTLPEETRRLREAHGAMKDGDPARALALLDEQASAYADGQLREEREAARVLALCKLGRAAEAGTAAAAFLRAHPRSPLADRVRASCATP